jgi:hypothetical protein
MEQPEGAQMTLFILFVFGVLTVALYWMHLNSGDMEKLDIFTVFYFIAITMLIGALLLKAST